MKRRTFLWIAALVMGVAMSAQAAKFTMGINANDSTAGAWLTFGMNSTKSIAGIPPIFYASAEYLSWLEGPGDIDVAYNVDDYSRLTIYIKEEANAALWKVFVRDDQKFTFSLKSGSLPAGSVLKLYKEGDEANAVNLQDGTVVNMQANSMYLIDYRETSSTAVALACPTVKHFQMTRTTNPQVLDLDVPDGYTLAADSAVIAYKAEEGGMYSALSGSYGSFTASTSTLKLTKTTDVDLVQFNYWYKKGSATTEKAVVIVNVNSGLATSLVSRVDAATSTAYTGAVVTVDPAEAGYEGTILTYKIDYDDKTAGKELTYSVQTPLKLVGINDSYAVEYAFSDTEDYAGAYTAMPAGGAKYTSNASTKYLKLKVTVTDKCESGEVEPSITTADAETIEMAKVAFYVFNGGTLDIDGNGEITEDDAIMMYNFIALGGVDDPQSMYEDDIIQGVSGEVDATAALAVLRSLAAFLDYDGGGTITEDDAIMMYNFIALGGVDDPDSMYEDDIIQGVSGEVDPATALANLKAYAKKK
jgi:hypothetical protein